MTDLTKIDRPFGLLDEATQKALRECGGPWEELGLYDGVWKDAAPIWGAKGMTYRQKPPKPREWFAVNIGKVHVGMWPDIEHAKRAADRPDAEIIHVREVMPE